jgi:hypothetical protein
MSRQTDRQSDRQTDRQTRPARRYVACSSVNHWSGSGSAYRRPIGFAVAGVGVLAIGAALVVGPGCSPARAESASLPSRTESECCSYFRPASENPDGFWLTTLLPGGEYRFALLPGSSLPPGGEWEAEFGEIEPDGTYRAPRVAPPSGLDSVRYTASGGLVATAWIRLEEAPGNSLESAYTVPDGFFSKSDYLSPDPPPTGGESLGLANPPPSQGLRESWIRTHWAQRRWLEQNVPKDGRWHGLRRSTESEEPDLAPLSDCTEITTVANGGFLPTSTYIGSVERLDLLGIQSGSPGVQQKAPQRCKAGPLYPAPDWKGQPCQPSGKRAVVPGPVKTYQKDGVYESPAGEITITAELAGELWRLFGIKIAVGAKVVFSRQQIIYRRIQSRDVYECVDGRWQYVRSETCEQRAEGELTRPEWYAELIDGYPGNGAPNRWSPWFCNALP